jgi:lipopolysaccharide transport system ATP-binding protein
LTEEASVLEDISFSLKPGDRLAVTGPNGSGKTTLLRILAGGIPLTSGSIEHHGHLVSLINPRAGINPEATGYENVLLRGLYLNQSVRHMREIAPQIIEFSELGDAIYKPVRAYSSGMRARLAFSIMVHSNPDIVVIDEWIGVGDRAFHKKAAARMREFVDGRKITVFATHNEGLKNMICNRELSLRAGRVEKLT